ncbi:lytic murein transglycosylase [Phyllobacterium salinisoli]|uniref:Lytic murein transglycosylase n=1 Tax=Phyllobacterium salinisoli TaxID=1899321 RepID=A0A368K8G2_9HYPH|nr:lytic murein transglycosylase [Phyllobacterium salinisoli]
MESLGAPLCPAGHLPRKGGDWKTQSSPSILQRLRLVPNIPEGVISPHAGEMAGKPEGGAVPPAFPSKNKMLLKGKAA